MQTLTQPINGPLSEEEARQVEASSVVLQHPLTPPDKSKITVQQYFALERTSEIRHEYVDGEIIPMPGESLVHNRIAGNFYTCLDRAFEDRPCEVYIESVRLLVSPTRYRYPDVVALCGAPVTDGENPPALLNPLLIVEVLSASTEVIDRGEKFDAYRHLVGLTDYVLVAQERVSVLHCVRQWTLTEYTELAETLTFATLEVTLTLADIYRRVPLSTSTSAAASA